MIRTELAEMIKSARERKGLTQVELAEIASIPAGTLGRCVECVRYGIGQVCKVRHIRIPLSLL